MTTKLTLTIEKAIIQEAKEYAHKTGRSLSELIESYLESIIHGNNNPEASALPPRLKKLFGSASISTDLDHKKEIRKILSSRDRK